MHQIIAVLGTEGNTAQGARGMRMRISGIRTFCVIMEQIPGRSPGIISRTGGGGYAGGFAARIPPNFPWFVEMIPH